MLFEVSKMVNIYDNVIEVCDVFNKTRNSILLLVLFCLQIRTLFNLSPNSAICNVIQSKCVLHILEYLGTANEVCKANFCFVCCALYQISNYLKYIFLARIMLILHKIKDHFIVTIDKSMSFQNHLNVCRFYNNFNCHV